MSYYTVTVLRPPDSDSKVVRFVFDPTTVPSGEVDEIPDLATGRIIASEYIPPPSTNSSGNR